MTIHRPEDLVRCTGETVTVEAVTCRAWLRDFNRSEPAALRLQMEDGGDAFATGPHAVFARLPQRRTRVKIIGTVDIVPGLGSRVIRAESIQAPSPHDFTNDAGLLGAECRLADAERLVRSLYPDCRAEHRPIVAGLLAVTAALTEAGKRLAT